jgi:haloalkane dehalogenase
MSTWAWATPPAEFHTRVLPWRMMHAPLIGPYLLGRHAAMPGRGMYLSVVDRARFTDTAQSAYEDVLADPDERALTWTWPRSIPLGLPGDVETDRFAWLEAGARKLDLPSTIIWGREDDVFAADVFAARWHAMWPHAEGTHLVTGKHFLHEDSGAEIGALLVEFADRRVRGNGGDRP